MWRGEAGCVCANFKSMVLAPTLRHTEKENSTQNKQKKGDKDRAEIIQIEHR